jgi:hypothetical protein
MTLVDARRNTTAARMMALRWQDPRTLQVDGVEFRLTWDLDELHAWTSGKDSFVLGKTPRMVEALVAHAPPSVRTIVDLGIFKGGSVVLYEKLFRPEVLLAVDLTPEPVPALTDYIEENHLSSVVRPCYGVDQADSTVLGPLLEQHVGDPGLDLVVDDCSHLYEPSRASFEILFPWLRPGGLYVLEDWGWAHWAGSPWQDDQGPLWGAYLSNLLFEWTMLAASRPDLVDSLTIEPSAAYLRRGSGELARERFSLNDNCLMRRTRFVPIGDPE